MSSEQRFCARCGEPLPIGCHGNKKGASPSLENDLTGKDFGPLHVIGPTGTRDTGRNLLYLCKCSLCGGEKVFPACSLRQGQLKSCGCQEHNPERMKEMSRKAVAANIADGVNLSSALSEKPLKNNKLGIRGVRYDEKRKHFAASCMICGERWYGWGYKTAEEAKEARDAAHQRLLEKYNVKGKHNAASQKKRPGKP